MTPVWMIHSQSEDAWLDSCLWRLSTSLTPLFHSSAALYFFMCSRFCLSSQDSGFLFNLWFCFSISVIIPVSKPPSVKAFLAHSAPGPSTWILQVFIFIHQDLASKTAVSVIQFLGIEPCGHPPLEKESSLGKLLLGMRTSGDMSFLYWFPHVRSRWCRAKRNKDMMEAMGESLGLTGSVRERITGEGKEMQKRKKDIKMCQLPTMC